MQKTIIAVKPISPGSSRRNGVTEAWKDDPKTSGISGGTSAALRTMLASVTYIAERQARKRLPEARPRRAAGGEW